MRNYEYVRTCDVEVRQAPGRREALRAEERLHLEGVGHDDTQERPVPVHPPDGLRYARRDGSVDCRRREEQQQRQAKERRRPVRGYRGHHVFVKLGRTKRIDVLKGAMDGSSKGVYIVLGRELRINLTTFTFHFCFPEQPCDATSYKSRHIWSIR